MGRRQIMMYYHRNRGRRQTLTLFGSRENAIFEQLFDNFPTSMLAFDSMGSISSRGASRIPTMLPGLFAHSLKNQQENAMTDSPMDIFRPDLFRGKTALVTGGGRGIGLAIAEGFARYGANIVIAGRHEETLNAAVERFAADGTQCLAVKTNIRDTAGVDTLIAAATGRFGHIDFLINNAGGQFPARPSQISDGGWRAVVDLNLNGTWNMCSRVAPLMAERGFGAIVNLVHVYAFNRGAPPFVHSGAARAGVVSMTQSMSYYLARKGVTINALAPGTIDTQGVHEEEFASAEYQDLAQSTLRDVPAHRMGTAVEMAAVTLFLCSPAARYINGASIVADGAQFMGNWAPMVDPEQY